MITNWPSLHFETHLTAKAFVAPKSSRDCHRLQPLRAWGHEKSKEGHSRGAVGGLAVRTVLEHKGEYPSEWAANRSIAEKIGCSGGRLRNWVRRAGRDACRWPGLTTEERERIKELEREARELRRPNEVLYKASTYFAQAEKGRRPKQW